MIYASFDYHSDAEWAAVNWPEVQKYWPSATAEKPSHGYFYTSDAHRLSYAEAQALADAGVKLSIKPLPGAMLTRLREDRPGWDRQSPAHALQSGATVQITVADLGLLVIDEVSVHEDCCTDALQSYLDEGWRILAVCPPNAARRPDYILGRRKAAP